jgi:hypothetical protein
MSMTIDGLGSMSQVSLAKMQQEMFKKLDQNGDGKIDKTEFAAARPKDDTRKTDETSKADEMFSAIDTDQDGSISEAESDAFLAKMEEGKKTQRPPFAPQAGQDWQAGLLTAMFANANRDERQSATSMSLYV